MQEVPPPRFGYTATPLGGPLVWGVGLLLLGGAVWTVISAVITAGGGDRLIAVGAGALILTLVAGILCPFFLFYANSTEVADGTFIWTAPARRVAVGVEDVTSVAGSPMGVAIRLADGRTLRMFPRRRGFVAFADALQRANPAVAVGPLRDGWGPVNGFREWR